MPIVYLALQGINKNFFIEKNDFVLNDSVKKNFVFRKHITGDDDEKNKNRAFAIISEII